MDELRKNVLRRQVNTILEQKEENREEMQELRMNIDELQEEKKETLTKRERQLKQLEKLREKERKLMEQMAREKREEDKKLKAKKRKEETKAKIELGGYLWSVIRDNSELEDIHDINHDALKAYLIRFKDVIAREASKKKQ